MNPKISVITVCFQAAQTLEKTILSVIGQSYPYVEYIIIDGGSDDGTIDIIRKYEHCLAFWESKPDKGIYDAMNKGLNHASGKWVSFINAGDKYYNSDVLSNIFSIEYPGKSIIYGNTQFVRPQRTVIEKSLPPKWLLRNMPTCHQSFFVLTVKAKEKGFNLKYKYAADYNMIYTIIQESGLESVCYVPVVVSTYNACEGSSMQYPNEVFHETLIIRRKSLSKFYGYFRYYVKKMIGRK